MFNLHLKDFQHLSIKENRLEMSSYVGTNVALPTIRAGSRSFRLLSKFQAYVKSNNAKSNNSTKDEGPRYKGLDRARLAYLDRVVRVDQAGELGANYIYQGQIFVLQKQYPELRPVLDHMWKQEVHHHDTFNNYQIRNRVRPSLITPLWKVGAFAMGATTAWMSPETAMACTEAVETVIGGHYNEQLRTLENQYEMKNINNENRYSKPHEVTKLISTIREFRDDELEHLHTALKYGAQKARFHTVVNETIKVVCKGAIMAAERI
ncbi:hypothetical protein TPHA_0J02630 [Tetrapisispora phaffii CBS 4417]|uniref:5-demethoxyubiquinone hydroxylase, mitochondrial n=1 Tax=Tetrapisispora phaffii (strain ATCC 24235 / CBS 4417 / NBRC 1672 / NRRL Y-8282 / UCD 70-5) TaxID=1071381 RepID=G8BYZ1_TETPH|nr:hypothetical protein TPHA_0J02630 [Tetrapisispora phaffii CBS 4417]CCE65083.1 hypothetical protein TPHA_0J02630 [Tetrapisispora phaffii CBS 4417]